MSEQVPCPKNCPDRKVGCRHTCKYGYDEWEKKHNAEREAAYEKRRLDYNLKDAEVVRAERISKKGRRYR